MKVSIIIPTLNDLKNLRGCIASIKKQIFDNYEVWIIDGNSNDGTKEYLRNLKKPFFWISEDDKGIYDAMNKGVCYAKGDWIYFLGSDDKLYNHNVLNDIFTKNIKNNTQLLLGKTKYQWRKNDSIFIKKNAGLFKPSWSNKLWFHNTLAHQGVFYKRAIFKEIKYDLQYKVLADYALNLHLFILKVEIEHIDCIVALCDTNGISKNYNWSMYKEEIQLKSEKSIKILKPLFIMMSTIKFLLKKLGI